MIPGFTGTSSLQPLTRSYRMVHQDNDEIGRTSAIVPQQGIRVWGNWCGENVSGPEPPIDDLDACCQRHDNCYGARGGDACSCDNEFRDCLSGTTWGPYPSHPKNEAYQRMAAAFQVKPCDETR